MRIIESSANPRIKQIQKIVKARDPLLFPIEGKKLIQEALESKVSLLEIFHTPEFSNKEQRWLEQLKRGGMKLQTVTARVFKSLSGVSTPQGILGIARRMDRIRSRSIERLALFLISMRDPGNFGAILRTAEACGCEWVAYSSDCVDPFQSKVVRSAMGSLFRVPLMEVKSPKSFLQEHGKTIQSCGLDPHGSQSLIEWHPRFPLLVCIGSESHGLPPDLSLDQRISIPMKGKVESLNAAVAAAVFLYAVSFASHR